MNSESNPETNLVMDSLDKKFCILFLDIQANEFIAAESREN